jgi:tetratricopeptide (TPR) repeat protein
MLQNTKYLKSFILFVFIFFIITNGFCQHREKSYRLFKKAESLFVANKVGDAVNFCRKAIKKDSTYVDPLVLLGSIYEQNGKNHKALILYKQALLLDIDDFPDLPIMVAELALKTKDYSAIISILNKYLKRSSLAFAKKEKVLRLLALAQFRDVAMRNPEDVQIKKLKNSIRGADEYVNCISLDGKEIYFTLKSRMDTTRTGQVLYEEQILRSNVFNDSIADFKTIEFPSGFNGRVGAASVSVDGRYLFFTVAYHKHGYGNCDLFYMDLLNERQKVINMGEVINTKRWDAQACFSADGKTLFFASKRDGGYGGSDIWISELNENGYWKQPRNAGSMINTNKNEMAPFIHADAQSLYFSSEGHIGMGGYDLFISRKGKNNIWSKAENLGFPINTESDEINIVIAPNGEDAYISVKKDDFDMYAFKLESHKANEVFFITGRIYNNETKEPIEAKIELFDLNQNALFAQAISFEDGLFKIPFPKGKHYAFHVNKKGYLFYSKNYFENIIHSDTLEIGLFPIQLHANVKLNNIFFEKDKSDLKAESRMELLKLVQFMIENPELKIEIGGHTDDTGSSEYNIKLSEERAKSVYDFLIKYGIDIHRLSYKGYGETKPIIENSNDENRAMNRRTEFRVVDIVRRVSKSLK